MQEDVNYGNWYQEVVILWGWAQALIPDVTFSVRDSEVINLSSKFQVYVYVSCCAWWFVVDWTHNAGYIVFSSVVHCCFETGGLNHERCWSCRRHTRGMLFRPCVLQIGTPTKVSGPKTADCFAMGNGVGCYHWSVLLAKIVCGVESAHSRSP